jgi:microcystin-dependent protein
LSQQLAARGRESGCHASVSSHSNKLIDSLAGNCGLSLAYTLGYSVVPGAYVDGLSFLIELHAAPGAGATLNVGGLGAIPLRHFYNGTWYLLPPSWCAAGSVLRVIYHASSGVFCIADSVQTIPTGTSLSNRSPTAPAGWMAEDGSAVSRTQYPALFAAIGTTYGAGDGSTTFNLPDSSGYVDAGAGGPLGGSLAQRLGGTTNTATTTVSVGVSGALSGGNVNNLPNVSWQDGPGGTHTACDQVFAGQISVSVSGSLFGGGSGTSGAFGIVQPTMIANKMIRI